MLANWFLVYAENVAKKVVSGIIKRYNLQEIRDMLMSKRGEGYDRDYL